MPKFKRLLPATHLLVLFISISFLFISPYKNIIFQNGSISDTTETFDTDAIGTLSRVFEEKPESILLIKNKDASSAAVPTEGANQREKAAALSRGADDVQIDVFTHKISAENVNLRDNPNTTSSKVITRLNTNEKISIVSRSGDWSRIETSEGTTGWVSNDFVLDKDAPIPKKKELPVGQKIAETARKYIGVRYVWGGTSPKGFDCSGLMKYVYSKYGVRLNRVAADQARQGTKVTRENLKPGDLVFFDTDGGRNYINHVGMYIGGGQFIHASSGRASGHRVVISSLSNSFYSKSYMSARRIVN